MVGDLADLRDPGDAEAPGHEIPYDRAAKSRHVLEVPLFFSDGSPRDRWRTARRMERYLIPSEFSLHGIDQPAKNPTGVTAEGTQSQALECQTCK